MVISILLFFAISLAYYMFYKMGHTKGMKDAISIYKNELDCGKYDVKDIGKVRNNDYYDPNILGTVGISKPYCCLDCDLCLIPDKKAKYSRDYCNIRIFLEDIKQKEEEEK